MATAKRQRFTIPGLTDEQGAQIVAILQSRLSEYNDLQLTLKHVHWNVVGPNFIGVHEMIDPQVDLVRLFADAVAVRIAALGGTPLGTGGAIMEDRAQGGDPLRPAGTASTEPLRSLFSAQYIKKKAPRVLLL